MEEKTKREFHSLPPLFNKDSKILILGSFPSPKSREINCYYGHKQNRFWKVMSLLFNEQINDDVNSRFEFMLRKKIALFDVVGSCEIAGAMDSSIKDATPNDLSVITSVADIKQIFTTGMTAYKLYAKFHNDKPLLLPSTSPANCAKSLEQLVKEYSIIKRYLD